MRTLNTEAFFGFDYGHLLLVLGIAGAVGFTGMPRALSKTMNRDIVGGFDVGHIVLGIGLASTLGLGFYKR
jgi:hypothetical protein